MNSDFALLNSNLTIRFFEIEKHFTSYCTVFNNQIQDIQRSDGLLVAFFVVNHKRRNARLEQRKRNTDWIECIFKRLCKTWIFTITFSTVQNPHSKKKG